MSGDTEWARPSRLPRNSPSPDGWSSTGRAIVDDDQAPYCPRARPSPVSAAAGQAQHVQAGARLETHLAAGDGEITRPVPGNGHRRDR